jgi:type II secretory pathway pseudopilin PulG
MVLKMTSIFAENRGGAILPIDRGSLGQGMGSPLHAFTLIEVVISLAIISFALVLIVGLLGLGISNNRDSSNRLQAVNIASLLISTRRSSPTNALSQAFALPPLGGTNAAGMEAVTPTLQEIFFGQFPIRLL